jgi:hypothetical protein
MLARDGGPTVAVVAEESEPEDAVMVAVPWPALLAKPFVPVALLMTMTAEEDDVQLTIVVTSWVVPSV